MSDAQTCIPPEEYRDVRYHWLKRPEVPPVIGELSFTCEGDPVWWVNGARWPLFRAVQVGYSYIAPCPEPSLPPSTPADHAAAIRAAVTAFNAAVEAAHGDGILVRYGVDAFGTPIWTMRIGVMDIFHRAETPDGYKDTPL